MCDDTSVVNETEGDGMCSRQSSWGCALRLEAIVKHSLTDKVCLVPRAYSSGGQSDAACLNRFAFRVV